MIDQTIQNLLASHEDLLYHSEKRHKFEKVKIKYFSSFQKSLFELRITDALVHRVLQAVTEIYSLRTIHSMIVNRASRGVRKASKAIEGCIRREEKSFRRLLGLSFSVRIPVRNEIQTKFYSVPSVKKSYLLRFDEYSISVDPFKPSDRNDSSR